MKRKVTDYTGLTRAFDALVELNKNLRKSEALNEQSRFVKAYLKDAMQRELLDFLVTKVGGAMQKGLTHNHNAEVSLANKSVEFSVPEWLSDFANYLEEESGEIDGKAHTTRNTSKWGAVICLSTAAVAGAILFVTHLGFMPFTLTDPHAITAMVFGGIAFVVGAACLGKFVSIPASRHAQKQRFESELSVFRKQGGTFRLEAQVKKDLESAPEPTVRQEGEHETRRRSNSVMTDVSYSTDVSD